jgi:proteasome lid subunit RPN8/RPN11
MADCGCNDIPVYERAPEGFRSFTRGYFTSRDSALRVAKKRAKGGAKNVCVVHSAANRLYGEAWHVGYVETDSVATEPVPAAQEMAQETAEAVYEMPHATVEAKTVSAPPSTTPDVCTLAEYYELHIVPDRFRECIARGEAFGKIINSKKLYDLTHQSVRHEDQEVFDVVAIGAKLHYRGIMRIHKGGRSETLVEPKIVLQAGQAMGATAIACVHQHPSGDAHPSAGDAKVTERIKKACAAAGYGFFDHLVIGADQYYSFTDRKMYRIDAQGNARVMRM